MGDCKERAVCPGEIYRHFKGNLYQIVAMAVHSETAETMVVYQALYGDFQVYVRPYEQFAGKVDRAKYPDAAQDYRFERMSSPAERFGKAADSRKEEKPGPKRKPEPERNPGPERKPEPEGKPGPERMTEPKKEAGPERKPNCQLMAFLEAENLEEKIVCLREMKGSASQSDLDSIYVVLDMQAGTGSVEKQLDEVIRRLSLQKHYEGGRLR